MAQSFEDITWNDGDDFDVDKLNQMQSNAKFLLDSAGTFKYTAYDLNRDTGVKIYAGTALVTPTSNSDRQIQADVQFGRFFTPNSKPVVVASVIDNAEYRIMLALTGIGSDATPTHVGFRVYLNADPLSTTATYFQGQVYVSWIAVGY